MLSFSAGYEPPCEPGAPEFWHDRADAANCLKGATGCATFGGPDMRG